MRGGQAAGGNCCVAYTGFRCSVEIGCFAEPGALVHQAFEAAGPMSAKLVDVIRPHLVDNNHNNQLGTTWSGRCRLNWLYCGFGRGASAFGSLGTCYACNEK